jgi:hypothetical protein
MQSRRQEPARPFTEGRNTSAASHDRIPTAGADRLASCHRLRQVLSRLKLRTDAGCPHPPPRRFGPTHWSRCIRCILGGQAGGDLPHLSPPADPDPVLPVARQSKESVTANQRKTLIPTQAGGFKTRPIPAAGRAAPRGGGDGTTFVLGLCVRAGHGSRRGNGGPGAGTRDATSAGEWAKAIAIERGKHIPADRSHAAREDMERMP